MSIDEGGKGVRRASRDCRGATLIEALVSLAVLSLGTAGVASLVTTVTQANRRMAFQVKSLDIVAQFSAQVRAATCDVPPGVSGFNTATSDAALLPSGGPATITTAAGASAGWWDTPPPTSAITLVGNIPNTTPPIHVAYRAVDATPPAPYDGPPSLNIEVRAREITGDSALDAPTRASGYHIREFTVKKVCTQRQDSQGRGEWY